MSKYDPLAAFLKNSKRREFRLSFDELERILGFPLPDSKQYPAWWSNSATNNTMTRAWLDAGYRTEQIDVTGEKVTFRRVGAGAEEPSVAAIPSSPLFGSLKGTTFLAPGVDLTAPTLDPQWLKKYDSYDPSDIIAQREVAKIVSDEDLSVSGKIRALSGIKVPRAEIARLLGKRYQHVRNVLVAEEQKARSA